MNDRMNASPARTRRVTANLPVTLLEDACAASGRGITDTLVQGLLLVRATRAAAKARALRGRLLLDVDLEGSRERARDR
jgi:hypothetical protein